MENKIAIILGTRPEAIKLIPIYLELKKSNEFNPVLISTGQHTSMLEKIFDFFDVEPDIQLNVMLENQTLSSLSAILYIKLEKVFQDNNFSFVFVQGDTTTAFVSAVSAFYHDIKVAHIEAGLRTYDKRSPFPEEANRRMISNVTDIHFAPTKIAVSNLYKENIIENVYEVGNTVIDSLFIAKNKIDENIRKYTSKYKSIIDDNKKIILVTGHRRESFGKGFEEICNALIDIAKNHKNIQIIYPVHMNPNVKRMVYNKLENFDNITLLSPLPYDDLIYIMSKSWLIMTDSGGIQEEAPSFNVPVIVMRDKTEREEGIESGCAVLGGTNRKFLLEQFNIIFNSQNIYCAMCNADNPYGDGKTSKKVVEIIRKII